VGVREGEVLPPTWPADSKEQQIERKMIISNDKIYFVPLNKF